MKWKAKAAHVVRRTMADGTVKEYRYARRRVRQEVKTPDSLAAAIEQWQNSPGWRKLSPSTQTNYTHYLKPLWRIGHVSIRAMRRADLLAIVDQIAKDRGDGAGLGFARVASKLFAFALDRELLEHSPAQHLAKDLPKGKLPAWTNEEAQLALAKLPEPLRRVVLLALYTGQRRGDLCSLRWAAFDGECIRLTQEKTEEPLVIPCHPVLQAELAAWKAEATTLTILANADGKPWKPNLLSYHLPAALKRLGISCDINVHGLRKLAAANLAEAGCSANEIAAITGHRTLRMVQFYTRSADQKRLAGAAIIRLTKAEG
jgi:integrase